MVPCNFVEELENLEDFQEKKQQHSKQEDKKQVEKTEEKHAEKPTTSIKIKPSVRLISPIREDIKLRKSLKKSNRSLSGKNFLKTDSVSFFDDWFSCFLDMDFESY